MPGVAVNPSIVDQIFTLRVLLTGVERKMHIFVKNRFSERFFMQFRACVAPPPHSTLKKHRCLIQCLQVARFFTGWSGRNGITEFEGGVPEGLPAVPGVAV